MNNSNTSITDTLLKQIESQMPSTNAIRALDAALSFISQTRSDLARNTDVPRAVILWAFERGKSDRAEEVRRVCLRELRAMIKQDQKHHAHT